MKHAGVLRGCGILLLLVSGVGCASKSGATPKSAEPASVVVPEAPVKGHWTTLPPETGSHIPRRVWVNEDGTIAATPGGSPVERYDPRVMQEWQRRGLTQGSTGD
jgi:hypothetical protein